MGKAFSFLFSLCARIDKLDGLKYNISSERQPDGYSPNVLVKKQPPTLEREGGYFFLFFLLFEDSKFSNAIISLATPTMTSANWNMSE